MLEQIADSIISSLDMSEGDKSKYELNMWGIKEILHNLINILTMVVIGAIVGKMAACVIFYISYTLLRSFAGGYHADTRLRCYLFSTFMLAAFILTIDYLAGHIAIASVIVMVATALVAFLAPVDNRNKMLYEKEKKFFKRIALTAVFVEAALYVIAIIVKWHMPAACLAESIMWVSIMLTLGKIKLGKAGVENDEN